MPDPAPGSWPRFSAFSPPLPAHFLKKFFLRTFRNLHVIHQSENPPVTGCGPPASGRVAGLHGREAGLARHCSMARGVRAQTADEREPTRTAGGSRRVFPAFPRPSHRLALVARTCFMYRDSLCFFLTHLLWLRNGHGLQPPSVTGGCAQNCR